MKDGGGGTQQKKPKKNSETRGKEKNCNELRVDKAEKISTCMQIKKSPGSGDSFEALSHFFRRLGFFHRSEFLVRQRIVDGSGVKRIVDC